MVKTTENFFLSAHHYSIIIFFFYSSRLYYIIDQYVKPIVAVWVIVLLITHMRKMENRNWFFHRHINDNKYSFYVSIVFLLCPLFIHPWNFFVIMFLLSNISAHNFNHIGLCIIIDYIVFYYYYYLPNIYVYVVCSYM